MQRKKALPQVQKEIHRWKIDTSGVTSLQPSVAHDVIALEVWVKGCHGSFPSSLPGKDELFSSGSHF
jgi:hypothetical protein